MKLNREELHELTKQVVAEIKREYILIPYNDKLERQYDYTETTRFIMDTASFVSSHMGHSRESVLSKTSKKPYPDIRKIITYLVLKYGNPLITLEQIGLVMGGRDHATMINNNKRCKDLMSVDVVFKGIVEDVERAYNNKVISLKAKSATNG